MGDLLWRRENLTNRCVDYCCSNHREELQQFVETTGGLPTAIQQRLTKRVKGPPPRAGGCRLSG